MKKDVWGSLQNLFPFLGLIVIIIVFSAISGDKLWTANNMLGILNLMIPLALGGAGMVFVSAQGSTDMSMGSTVALTAALGGLAAMNTGIWWVFIPVAIVTGLGVGIFNGTMVSKFKVSSIMVTLAMLIALRAIVSFVTNGQPIFVDSNIIGLNKIEIKLPVFIIVIAIMWYLFERTKAGFFSRSIGENEVVGRFAGIPTTKFKILAFALSGLMAGLVGVFNVGNIGGVSPSMGNFFELQVMTAIFVGGIPVTGGAGAKFYKVIVGALMLAFLQNGLAISKVSAEMSELIQGIILIAVVFFGLFVREKFIERQAAIAAKES